MALSYQNDSQSSFIHRVSFSVQQSSETPAKQNPESPEQKHHSHEGPHSRPAPLPTYDEQAGLATEYFILTNSLHKKGNLEIK